MAQALKRIQKELVNFNKEEPEGFTAGPIDVDHMFTWEATITGPENSPYEDGTFSLNIEFPRDYPFKPPEVLFTTKIFHPNVCMNYSKGFLRRTTSGLTTLGMLYDKWDPNFTVIDILMGMKNLLINPDLELYYEPDIAKLYREDKKEFDKIAKEWTEKYAKFGENNEDNEQFASDKIVKELPEKNDKEIYDFKNLLEEEKQKNVKFLKRINELENLLTSERNKNKKLEEEIALLRKEKSNDNTKDLLFQKYLEIEELKKKIGRFPFELNKDEKLMTVKFYSTVPNIPYYCIITKNSEPFINLEKKLYEKYKESKNPLNYFIANENIIDKFATLEENKIKDNDIINIYLYDHKIKKQKLNNQVKYFIIHLFSNFLICEFISLFI